MNVKKLSCSLLFSMGYLGLAAAHSAESGNVRIGFAQPEKFPDFRIQGPALLFRIILVKKNPCSGIGQLKAEQP